MLQNPSQSGLVAISPLITPASPITRSTASWSPPGQTWSSQHPFTPPHRSSRWPHQSKRTDLLCRRSAAAPAWRPLAFCEAMMLRLKLNLLLGHAHSCPSVPPSPATVHCRLQLLGQPRFFCSAAAIFGLPRQDGFGNRKPTPVHPARQQGYCHHADNAPRLTSVLRTLRRSFHSPVPGLPLLVLAYSFLICPARPSADAGRSSSANRTPKL